VCSWERLKLENEELKAVRYGFDWSLKISSATTTSMADLRCFPLSYQQNYKYGQHQPRKEGSRRGQTARYCPTIK
jgi:hypothetical protein